MSVHTSPVKPRSVSFSDFSSGKAESSSNKNILCSNSGMQNSDLGFNIAGLHQATLARPQSAGAWKPRRKFEWNPNISIYASESYVKIQKFFPFLEPELENARVTKLFHSGETFEDIALQDSKDMFEYCLPDGVDIHSDIMACYQKLSDKDIKSKGYVFVKCLNKDNWDYIVFINYGAKEPIEAISGYSLKPKIDTYLVEIRNSKIKRITQQVVVHEKSDILKYESREAKLAAKGFIKYNFGGGDLYMKDFDGLPLSYFQKNGFIQKMNKCEQDFLSVGLKFLKEKNYKVYDIREGRNILANSLENMTFIDYGFEPEQFEGDNFFSIADYHKPISRILEVFQAYMEIFIGEGWKSIKNMQDELKKIKEKLNNYMQSNKENLSEHDIGYINEAYNIFSQKVFE